MNTDYKVGDFIYNADIYDGLNNSLSDLEFYKKWLPQNKDAKILELCCGTGRLTIPIAKDGYNIKGVDYTLSMLERAKEKAFQAGLKIDFIEADIRGLNLEEKFDLIFIPFNSIHHLYKNEDLFDTLKVVRNHLKEKGLFLLDCFNPNIQYIVENERKQQVIAEYTTNDGRKVLIKQSMHYESASQINRIKWQYFIDDKFHSVQNMDMRLFFPQELNSYLKQIGFNIIHKFGDFTEGERLLARAEQEITADSLEQLPAFSRQKVLSVEEMERERIGELLRQRYSKEEIARLLGMYKSGRHFRNGELTEQAKPCFIYRRAKCVSLRPADGRGPIVATADGECAPCDAITAQLKPLAGRVLLPKPAYERFMAQRASV